MNAEILEPTTTGSLNPGWDNTEQSWVASPQLKGYGYVKQTC